MSGSSTGNGIHIVHLNCLSAYQGWSFHRVVYLTKISNDLHKSCSLMHDPMIHNLIARGLVMQKHATLEGIVWIFNYNKSPVFNTKPNWKGRLMTNCKFQLLPLYNNWSCLFTHYEWITVTGAVSPVGVLICWCSIRLTHQNNNNYAPTISFIVTLVSGSGTTFMDFQN